MKIAIYKRNDYEHVGKAYSWMDEDGGYIRVTEVVDVDFQHLPPEVMVLKELAQLDLMEKELTGKHLKALEAIQTKRKDLLALAPPKAVTEAE